ncbi:MAG: TlpA family protein disulfide reductase [Nitrospinae bacterium]|nr:TlpA family protein disulfide reductase [Nitrospinota bacterium]MZH05089.1 TlpA family protein disulfide reductase [Nitrospinota bacterium]MZH14938.1 TlpA family protein disulfide reductase [Nitrospinota bacterium]
MKSTVLKDKSFTHLSKHGLLYFLIVVAGILFVLRMQFPVFSKIEITEGTEIGERAPGFKLRNLSGNLEGLDDYKDKVIVLNFWATWCAPCLEEMPTFEKLYRRYRSQGLTVLAVSLDKGNSDRVKKFTEENNFTFPVLIDTEGIAEKRYPSFSIPFTYVIDKKGRIAARVDGTKNWATNETFEALEILVKG